MSPVLVRYFAAARAAAGTEAETLTLDRPATRGHIQDLLARAHPHPGPGQPDLAQVLARSSYLLDGIACPDPDTTIPDEAVLDVLPPFSGG